METERAQVATARITGLLLTPLFSTLLSLVSFLPICHYSLQIRISLPKSTTKDPSKSPLFICQRENASVRPFHLAGGLVSYEREWERAPLQEPANTKRAKTIRTANSPGCLPPPSLNMCWRWIPLSRANTSDKRPRIKLARCNKTPIFTLSPPLRGVNGWPRFSQGCDS